MTGFEKAKEVANKLHEDKEQEELALVERRHQALDSLATLHANTDLAKMYTESAKVGADNLGGELPQLKIHATGKSTGNELADGSRPHDGYYFYKPTQEEFEGPLCHILTISRGFYAPGMADNKTGKTVDKFNQILGGVIIDGNDLKPFLMYFTGTKLTNLWEFGKAANKYTHAKPIPIPMFALTVRMTTAIEKTSFGENWVAKFEIQKNEDGTSVLVFDQGKFQFLKDSAEMLEESIDKLIKGKTSKLSAEEVPLDGNEKLYGSEEIPF